MKRVHRIISVLLVLVMVMGIMPSNVFSVETGTVVPQKITTIGSTGTLSGIPEYANKVTYLSDLYNTAAKKYSYVVPGGDGQIRDFSLDQNFFGTRVYAFTAANDSNRYAITKGASNLDEDGYRTLTNGIKVHYSDIVLGRDTTIFEKGLSFQPSLATSENQATVIFDITAQDAEYFYAVVGMTGEGNKAGYSDRKVTYRVYGSKDADYSSNMAFTELAYCENVRAYLMGEFNIPIAGYNYIKLVAESVGSSTSNAESVWADACVYSSDYTPSEDGTYEGLPIDDVTYLDNTLCSGYYNVGYNSTDKYAVRDWADKDAPGWNTTYSAEGKNKEYYIWRTAGTVSVVNSGNATGNDDDGKGPYRTVDSKKYYLNSIYIGRNAQKFEHGVSVIPTNILPSDTDATMQNYTLFDISQLDADYFYAVVGITGLAANRPGTSNAFRYDDVRFYVYGSPNVIADLKEGDEGYTGTAADSKANDSSFVLLASSGDVESCETGEFNVNITGYKTLKLVVTTGTNATSNTGGASVWADACVYSTTTEHSASVSWNDNNNSDSTRPDSVDLQLYANGTAYGSAVTVNAAGNWSHKWTELPKYDENWDAITYTVGQPTAPTGYTGSVNGSTVTNTYDPTLIKIGYEATIAWDHGTNPGEKPTSVTIQLYANGTQQDEVSVTETNSWRYSWTGLQKYDANWNLITYTVGENSAPSYYEATVSGSTITNTYDPTKVPTSFSVSTTWVDNDNFLNIRPESVTVQLFTDGDPAGTTVLNASNNWAYTWNNLRKYTSTGDEIDYTITVTPVEDYDIAVNGNSITLTCDPVTEFTTKVEWQGDDGVSGNRPDNIFVQLYADGQKHGTAIELNAANNWTYTWAELPEYVTGTATKVVYSVDVVKENNYDITINPDGTITNTYIPKVDFTAEIVWGDNNDEYNIRPESVLVYLKADGVVVGASTLNSANGWTCTWADLDQFAADGTTEIVYTVELSESVTDYDATTNGGTITLQCRPRISFSTSITWDDNNNALNLRPATVQVELFAGNESCGVKELNAANNYGCTWTNLYQYAEDGATEIVYTVKVISTGSNLYTAAVSGNTITCALVPLTGYDITVSWNHGSNRPSAHPGSVELQLYAGDTACGTPVTVTKDTDWKHSFVNLPKFAEDGVTEIVYTVKVVALPRSYTSSLAQNTLTLAFPTVPGKYTESADGSHGGYQAAEGSVIDLSAKKSETESTIGKYIIGAAVAPKGGTTTVRYPSLGYPFTGKTTDKIVLGLKDTSFSSGLGVLPYSLNTYDTYILLDISELDADHFYSIVGITGTSKGKTDNSLGVAFEVWGSKDKVTDADDDSFELLSISKDVFGKTTGEFDINIEGYKTLKLVTLVAKDSMLNSNLQSAWANTCLYTYKETEDDDDNTGGSTGDDSSETTPAEPLNFAEREDGKYLGITQAVKDSIIDLSDIKFVLDSLILPDSNGKDRPVRIDTTDLSKDEAIATVIGKADTKFTQHLTLHPTAMNDDRTSFVTLNVDGLDADRFYAAVGIAATKGKTEGKGVVFNVYGYDEAKKEYVLLASSGDIHGYESGEIDVSIAGYKTLKLEVDLAADSEDHYSRTSSWCNVSVYKYDPNASGDNSGSGGNTDSGDTSTETTPTEPLNFTEREDGKYLGITQAVKDSIIDLSDIKFVLDSLILPDSNGKDRPVRIDTTDLSKDDAIATVIGKANTKFTQHLTLHPTAMNDDRTSFVTLNVDGLDADRFYAAVGIAAAKGKTEGKGVVFNVYGYDEAKKEYVLLASSGDIHGYESGEIDVSIAGYKTLKLEVDLAADSEDYYSRASSWCNISVYKYDPNASGNNSAGNNNTGSTIEGIYGNYTGSDDGTYAGVPKDFFSTIQYLSELTYLEASNTTNDAYPNGQPTTLNAPYNSTGSFTIGENDTIFFVGLGVHPKNPKVPVDGSIESWTIYDVSKLDADRFYATVGLAAQSAKDKSQGVIFRVYGDYVGDGQYVLLAQSDAITGVMSGEFDVDITGVKTLKLAVVCAGTSHASSSSAWANACVYSTDVDSTVTEPTEPDGTDATEPSTAPTEPSTAPTEPGKTPAPASSLSTILVVLGIALTAITAAIVVIVIKQKKKRA